MAGRYLRLLVSAGVRDVLLVTGGLAADEGLLAALREAAAEQKAHVEIRSHPRSILAARSAALWARFACAGWQNGGSTSCERRMSNPSAIMLSLAGRVALVTGGGGGIGSAVAWRFSGPGTAFSIDRADRQVHRCELDRVRRRSLRGVASARGRTSSAAGRLDVVSIAPASRAMRSSPR